MKKSTRIIFASLAAILFLGIMFVPIPGIEPPAKVALAIFALALVLWVSEAIPLHITSFVIAGALAVFLTPKLPSLKEGYATFLSPFFSPTILLFLGGFILAAGLERFGLDSLIASAILKRVGKKPKAIVAGFMGVTALISMWMSNTAATAIMIAVALPLVRAIDKDDPLRIAILIGIPFGANIGGIGTPIGTPPNAIAIAALKQHGIMMNFLEWMALAIPLVIILLVLTWLFLLLLFPPKTKEVDFKIDVERKMGWRDWVVIATMLATIVGWFTEPLHKIPDAIVALLPAVVFFPLGILRRKDFDTLGWDVLILMGGGLSLGKAVSVSGLDKWFVNSLGMQNLPPLAVFAGFVLIAIVLTNFISNTSSAALIIPLALGFGTQSGSLVIGVALGASASMLLPISTPPNAIAFNSGLLKVKDMLRVGAIVALIAAVLIFAFAVLIWPLLGLTI